MSSFLQALTQPTVLSVAEGSTFSHLKGHSLDPLDAHLLHCYRKAVVLHLWTSVISTGEKVLLSVNFKSLIWHSWWKYLATVSKVTNPYKVAAEASKKQKKKRKRSLFLEFMGQTGCLEFG